MVSCSATSVIMISVAAFHFADQDASEHQVPADKQHNNVMCSTTVYASCRLQHLQGELDSTLKRTSAQAQSLQASLAGLQKQREQLQSELQQARSALESRASEHEYMQSEASSLQQALLKQVQETQQAQQEAQQAQQACDGWMANARQQVALLGKAVVSV